jgi:hypothetical protein
MYEIDFVLLWVDGNDEEWRNDKNKYLELEGEKGESKFRDWDNLHYLFRAFEQFTPWVRKIHFVTYGHLPKWLNLSHPKLHIVKHSDYISEDYLPVFNANPLEINLHNIKGLSEKFVYFNDDTFITSSFNEERFFKNNLPCDNLISNAISSSSGVGHFVLNNIEILNKYFNKSNSIKNNILKWFNPKYGVGNLRNIALLPWSRFTGFMDPHQPQPFLKSTFEKVWSLEKEVLEKTSASKFRTCSDVNQYLFRYWQLAKGEFEPISMNDTKYITLTMDRLRNKEVSEVILSSRHSMVCLNDSDTINESEFEEAKEIIKNAFEKIFPDKSEFEI